MKRFILHYVAVVVLLATGVRGSEGNAHLVRSEVAATGGRERSGSSIVEINTFTTEMVLVERELEASSEFQRDDLLLMYGRSSSAAGRFDIAAAAYAIFLNEYGIGHPYSEMIVVGLGDCLFPFRYDEVNVVHTPSGPRLDPMWRTGHPPRPEYLQQAIQAFELTASLARNQYAKGAALLKLGWVHRVIGDWNASTAAWDRCANESAPAKSAADALWLAAENLEWTNRPAEAAERLGRMASDYPDDARTPAARDEIGNLQSEARRSADWLTDPVTSLVTEIEGRASSRSPFQVYRSVVRWLRRRGERTALIAVSRWACGQVGWTEKDQITSRHDLVDALLLENNLESQSEAADRLSEIVDIATDSGRAVSAGLRCSRILTELERFDDAERMMQRLAKQVEGMLKWEPVVLSEYATWLLDRNDEARARGVLETLVARHPAYDISDRFDMKTLSRKEGR